MKAIRIDAFGGPDVLQQVELPELAAGRSQALIAVEAAGVGYVDVLMRRGADHRVAAGFTPGAEIAGRVVAVGDDVDPGLVGARVFAITAVGGCAEQAVVEASSLIPLPVGLSFDDAVATGVNALVAHFGLNKLHLTAADRLLVRGASGGIGILAVQLAVLRGLQVTAATSAPDVVRRFGPAEIVGRAVDGAEGFDALFDPVGGPEFTALVGALRPEGRAVLVGVAGGFPAAEFGGAMLGNFGKSLTVSMQSLNSIPPARLAPALGDLFDLVVQKKLEPMIDRTISLAGVAEAHAAIEAGRTVGKVVVRPQPER